MAKAKKSPLPTILLTAVLLVVLGTVAFYFYTQVTNDIKGVNQEDSQYTLVIESKDFQYEVGEMLAHNGVVVSGTAWTNWMDKNYPNFEYTNGEYYMNANMSYEAIAEKLSNPDISHKIVKVCIPEGYNCMQIADALEENGICKASEFLEVCKSAEGYEYEFTKSIPNDDLIAYKLEGFLFPATYDFAMNSDPRNIADKMLDTFDLHITDDMERFCKDNDMTLFELVTLTSIVQEEAFGVSSAKNIASVFMNRLQKGAKLQSDVTYFYARDLRDTQGFSQQVYDSYYTYRCDGLPSGPITNCGADIMDATVNYPKTDYLYFYSDLQKEFHFAKTYDEFVSLQQKYPWK